MQTTETKKDEISYLKLTNLDLPQIVEAIQNEHDQLRLYFSVKSLRKILAQIS